MVIRVEKTKNYTVMSNHHLSNTKLSLKAKGLMSLMLSLPEDWDYTLKGLASICKDGVDSISAAIKELEGEGYMTRHRTRDDGGRLTGTEYVIHELPQTIENTDFSPKRENPVLDKIEPVGENPILDESPRRENPVQVKSPKRENPILDNPVQEKPVLENPVQLNTKYINNTNILNTDKSIYPSIQDNAGNNCQRMDEMELREMIKENIEYDVLISDPDNAEMVKELYSLIIETLTNSKQTEYVLSGVTVKEEELKARLRSLRSEHIMYVISSIKRINTSIRNVKRYMLTSLYNAGLTYHTSVNAGINTAAYKNTGTSG